MKKPTGAIYEAAIYAAAILCVFLVSAPLSLALQFYALNKSNAPSKPRLWIFAITLSTYLGIINSTKLVESDMQQYIEWYESAQLMDFWNYVTEFTKEPIYFAYSYFLSKISNGQVAFFIISFTATCYILIISAIIDTSKKFALTATHICLITIVCCFFPPLFSYSFHLNRQFLAASFLLKSYSSDGGRKYLWILLALFTHASAWFFLLLQLPVFKKPLSLKVVLTQISVIASAIFLISYLTQIISAIGLPVLSAVIDRVSQDEQFQLAKPSDFSIFFVLILTISSIWIAFRTSKFRFIYGAARVEAISAASISTIALGLLIIFCLQSPAYYEISVRYMVYFYFFASLVFIFMIASRPSLKKLTPWMCAFTVLYFFVNLEIGVWRYSDIFDLLFSPPLYLIFGASNV